MSRKTAPTILISRPRRAVGRIPSLPASRPGRAGFRGFGLGLLMCAGLLSARPSLHGGETYFIDAIVPAPQAVEYGRWLVFGESRGQRVDVSVRIPTGADRLVRAGAEAIRGRVEGLWPEGLRVAVVRGTKASGADLEVILGMSEGSPALRSAYAERGLGPIDRTEAYRIRTDRNGEGKPRFLLLGSDPRGCFYAAQSFVQMLTVRDGRLAVRALEVDDWPAFRSRASGNDEKPPAGDVAGAAIDWFSRFKMNAWPFGQSYNWPDDWRGLSERSREALRRARTTPGAEAVDLRYQIHPFGRAGDPEERFAIRISSSSDRRRFFELLREALRSGADDILLRADDFHELSSADERSFESKAEAHARLVEESVSILGEESPEARLYFCPPYYAGSMVRSSAEARSYLRAIGRAFPPEVTILWTGPEVVSDAFNSAAHKRYASLIGRSPYLWDNTVYQEESDFGYTYEYAWYMLHPMDTRYPENYSGMTPGIRFNFGFDGTWLNRIGNVVLADYLWNPSAYDPELSLRRAVALCVGPDGVDLFLEAAAKIRRIFDLKHSPARAAERSVPDNAGFRRIIRRLEARAVNREAVRELERHWRNLSSSVEQLNHIATFFGNLRSRESLVLAPGTSADWREHSEGGWSSVSAGRSAMFEHPFETPADAGHFGARSTTFAVPPSPSGRYFLHFVFDDSYRASGGPPASYPGYFYKQVLIDGDVVWENDAEGIEPILPTTVEVSHALRRKREVELTVRCVDKKGVTNLGLKATVSPLVLTYR